MAMRDRIIGLFYEAAVNPALWPVALDAFSVATQSIGAHLIVFDKPTMQPRGGYLASHAIDPATMGAYIQHYRQVDPLNPGMMDVPDQNLRLCHECVDVSTVAASEYYQDFLIPIGGRYQAGWALENNADRITILGLHQRKARFERQQLAQWEQVSRHARDAVKLSVRLGDRLAQGKTLRQAIDHRRMNCIMVDSTARVLDCSTAAHTMLDEGSFLKLQTNGQLAAVSYDATARLRSLIYQAATGGAGGTFQLAVEPADAPQFAQVVAGGNAADNPFDSRRSGCALVFVEDSRSAPQSNLPGLRALLDCTQAEAEVAALLAAGYTPTQIATERRVALSTVRSQIRILLSRTGLHRIAELVILLTKR